MQDKGQEGLDERIPLKSVEAVEIALKEIEKDEQLYSIALFDILGFSDFVTNNGTKVILDLYNRLLNLIDKQKSTSKGETSFAGSVVPVPISSVSQTNLSPKEKEAKIKMPILSVKRIGSVLKN